MQLPNEIDPIEFDEQYRLRPDLWREAIQEICGCHNIPFIDFHAFEDGSNLVASVAEHFIIKVFPIFHRHQWESECLVLQQLWKNSLSIPIPKMIAMGERTDGWTYVVLSKLTGITLERIWPTCSEGEKVKLMKSIGMMMAKVHSVPTTGLENLTPEWKEFLKDQIAKCRMRHERLKMPDWFVRSLDDYVSRNTALLPEESSVILTGEYTPFNLMVDGTPGDWHISGMIDFGDAMLGFREYDLLGPCLFLGEGNPRLLKALLKGYGHATIVDPGGLADRLMLLSILHRYSNLKVQLKMENWWDRVGSIAELKELAFPIR